MDLLSNLRRNTMGSNERFIRCKVADEHYLFFDSNGEEVYYFPVSQCDSFQEFTSWLCQLLEKRWFDREYALQFVKAVMDENKIARI